MIYELMLSQDKKSLSNKHFLLEVYITNIVDQSIRQGEVSFTTKYMDDWEWQTKYILHAN